MNCTYPPLDLPGIVPTARHVIAEVTAHAAMAQGTWRLRLRAPELARQIIPGQFFMVRFPRRSDPLLGRPFALFDTFLNHAGEPDELDFGYLVVGKLTSQLVDVQPGEQVELWGPLGNGFPPPPAGHLVIAAGGIGQTPFLAVLREALGFRSYGSPARAVTQRPEKITFCYGVRSASFLAGVEDFRFPGVDVQIATDDGSAGHHGYVTDLLRRTIEQSALPVTVYTCGPEPMLKRVAEIAREHETTCYVSLETPMACGFGACFSCVTKVAQSDGTWDYRRVCVEGPIFRADELVWSHEG